ncbi:MAG: hypothetical protein V7754_15495 [Halioglobus sp.]
MSAYRLINPTMNRLLASPWHRVLSKRIMSVSYRGRKSGQEYTTPVSYYREGNTVYCFTNGNWRHNFRSRTEATLRLQGKDYPATGELFTGSRDEQVDIMIQYFKAVPQDKKFYGVHTDTIGEPIRNQVEQASHAVVPIQFELQAH